MRLTIIYDPDGSTQLDVPTDMSIEDFKALVEAETGIPAARQVLFCKGNRLDQISGNTLAGEFKNADGSSAGKVEEDDMITVQQQAQRQQTAPQGGQSSRQPQQAGYSQALAESAERFRLAALADPAQLERLRSYSQELADAVYDSNRFLRAFEEADRRQREAEREKQEAMARLNDDPFDIESQRKIEEFIRMENVKQNMDHALENIPESFAKTTMLYIPVIVNGVKVKAFVDSGAQATIMSGDCAERTGLIRLLDRNFAGMARGVGTAPILGRIHVAPMTIGSVALHCSFTVMEGKDVDLLLGLDMLKRHQANINLKRSVLEIADIEVPFLPEHEIPQPAAEPVIQGPGGTHIGGRSGAVLGPGESQGQSQGQGSLSLSGSSQPAPASAPGQSASQAAGAAAAARSGGAPSIPPRSAQASSEFPRGDIDAVMQISGVSESEAVGALRATGGNVDAAAGMFFGD